MSALALTPTLKPIQFTPDYFLPYLTEGEAEILDHESFLINDRRARVASMYCSGMSIRKIVEELQKSPVFKPNGGKLGSAYNTVRDDLQVAKSNMHKRIARSMHEHIARELMILAHRESQIAIIDADYREQWEKSKGERTESYAETNHKGPKTSIKKWNGIGDARLGKLMLDCQSELLRCQEMRWRLLGLLNPLDDGHEMKTTVKIVVGIDPMDLV